MLFLWLQSIEPGPESQDGQDPRCARARALLSELEPIEMSTASRFIQGIDSVVSPDMFEEAMLDLFFYIADHHRASIA